MSNEYQIYAHLSNEDADEFTKENPYNFNEEEINVTKDFKKHVKSNILMIVGFLKIILKFLPKMYCGLLKSSDIKYDNMIIESILQEANKAITYYHL